MFEFDTYLLIECVREKPVLWNKKLKEYSEKFCRDKAWEEIGTSIYEKWMEFDLTEREDKVKEMKNKWRHVRDNFFKFMNQGRSSDNRWKKKKYIYADSLSFLLNTTHIKKTTKRIISENIPFDEKKKEADKRRINEGEDLDHEKIEAANVGNSIQPQPPRENFKSFQNEVYKTSDIISKQREDNTDKLFLTSLFPYYNEMDANEKLDFKLMTLQFFRDLRYKKRATNQMPTTCQFPGITEQHSSFQSICNPPLHITTDSFSPKEEIQSDEGLSNEESPGEGFNIHFDVNDLATITTTSENRRNSLNDSDGPSSKRKRNETDEQPDVGEESSIENQTEPDIFGQYVACKLKGYTKRTRNIVEHHVNNIIFKADMGEYDQPD